MKCPVCKESDLIYENLETDLRALACQRCGGYWISSTEYWRWLEHGAHSSSGDLPTTTIVKSTETDVQNVGKMCPECRHILVKYQVGHGESFSLDHCARCNGVWFDRNEWEVLRADRLTDKIHLVFTQPWQSEIRREAARDHFDRIYQSRFQENYEELKGIRDWIYQSPQKDAMIAFLDDPDPYSA